MDTTSIVIIIIVNCIIWFGFGYRFAMRRYHVNDMMELLGIQNKMMTGEMPALEALALTYEIGVKLGQHKLKLIRNVRGLDPEYVKKTFSRGMIYEKTESHSSPPAITYEWYVVTKIDDKGDVYGIMKDCGIEEFDGEDMR